MKEAIKLQPKTKNYRRPAMAMLSSTAVLSGYVSVAACLTSVGRVLAQSQPQITLSKSQEQRTARETSQTQGHAPAAELKDPPLLEYSKALIRAGKDQSAAAMLIDFLKTDPKQAKAHYLLGACFYHLRSYAAAGREFQSALKYGHDPHIQRAGSNALAAVTAATSAAAPAPSLKNARRDFDYDVDDTIERISESTEEKAMLEEEAYARRADRVIQDAEKEAKRLTEEEDAAIADLRNTRGGSTYIESVQNEYEEKIEFIRRRAMEHAKEIMAQGKLRKQAIEQAGMHVQADLSRSRHSSKLASPGTSFYVRNYRSKAQARAQPQASARASRLEKTQTQAQAQTQAPPQNKAGRRLNNLSGSNH